MTIAAFSGMGTTVTVGGTTFKAISITTPVLKRGAIDVTNRVTKPLSSPYRNSWT